MKNKFKPLKTRFRATFKGETLGEAAPPSVDKENEVLHGVQITLEGEALGHGVWLDREFCDAVAQQGNATGDVGLKVRYGHPAMCSDAIGTELGRAKNFRVVDLERVVDGVQIKAAGVIADVHLLKSAHSAPQGDIAKHVLETAAEDPKQFGQSIVFTYSDWVVKDKDGNRHSYNEEVAKPMDNDECRSLPYCEFAAKAQRLYDKWYEQSADGKIYAVLGKLHGSDFTDTPAATDGIFSTGTLAEEAEQMLDEHPDILAAIEKNPKSLNEFLERTGLDKRFESARLAGLQAAKDKEIAALKTERDSLSSQIADLKSANEKLTADIGAKDQALADAQESVKQLEAKRAEAEKALADSQAALADETERYREQVGAALQPPKSELSNLHGRELAVAAMKAKG